jgi:hypothetical protein
MAGIEPGEGISSTSVRLQYRLQYLSRHRSLAVRKDVSKARGKGEGWNSVDLGVGRVPWLYAFINWAVTRSLCLSRPTGVSK